jgi:hypothetical protein
MNSRSTTFPLNADRVNILPVKPGAGLFAHEEADEQTTGSVKSGACPDCDTVVVIELVKEEDPGVVGWVNEYTDQTATMMMIGMAIFSHLLRPRRFLATDCFAESLALLLFDDTDTIRLYEQRKVTLKLSLRIR